MSNTHHYVTVYPNYKLMIRAVEELPLVSRSLLIKLCQAQSIPESNSSSLAALIDNHPQVTIRAGFIPMTFSFRNLLNYINFNPYDPLDSAIALDICRGVSTTPLQASLIKQESWSTEIRLAKGERRFEEMNWNTIFGEEDYHRYEPLHQSLPENPTIARTIHLQLLHLRKRYTNKTLYARYTHKSVSRSTVRDMERVLLKDLTTGVAIVGQDDVLRIYHETGYFCQGEVEMRQRWYTSGAKPRTYFAMGGTAFESSRFLQDFFSDLVDSIPSTNHKTRLRPSRLVLPFPDEEDSYHWRIYDLSSFTSNCSIQRSFVKSLASFFSEVPVVIVDEHYGPLEVDLGDLLEQYYEICVDQPELTLERCQVEDHSYPFYHHVASMLGIFGNLMSCTFAHFATLSPFITTFDEYNCAGDDGLIPENIANSSGIDAGIKLVGSYAREKSFRGDEEGAICLKRPFQETIPNPTLLQNLVPPTLATVLLLLSDEQDPRFQRFGDETVGESISVVGKDLLRFLRSAHRMRFEEIERLDAVVNGFRYLVKKLTGILPTPGFPSRSHPYFWPVTPGSYGFEEFSHDPLFILSLYYSPDLDTVPVWEVRNSDEVEMECYKEGDQWIGNNSRRLKLLEMLGYVKKEEMMRRLETTAEKTAYWFWRFDTDREHLPSVYLFEISQTIPQAFRYV